MVYSEPQVSFLVLDFLREKETRLCLESIRRHVKFPHKIIYLHNGPADYPTQLLKEGLIDQLIQTAKNNGLGLGTRDLFAACFSPLAVYWQNDQIMGRDFKQSELDALADCLGQTYRGRGINHKIIQSISLAGATCGEHIFSERAFIIETANYKRWEGWLPLSPGGAGPFHHLEWREGQIQRYYAENDYWHWTEWTPLAIDRGVWTLRNNGGGRVRMRTDTKAVWWEETPTASDVFPEHTIPEWVEVLAGRWPPGKIPQVYLDRGQSFNCWGDQTP